MPGLAGETANLIVALKLDDKGFSGKINKIGAQLKGMDAGLSQVGRGVGQVGGGMARLAERSALLAAGGLGAVVTTAASFEQAFAGVRKTVNETANTSFADLNDQLREMARTMPVSFEELAGIASEGGALGIATDSLTDFTDVVARLSVSTNLSADEASTALGQLGNVLHLSGGDLREFGDELVALGNNGASTEDQIVAMAARFGAAGNSAGLSKEQILALSSAVASMGIEVEAGGSALSRVFNAVATNIGTGSSKAKAFAKVLGLSAKDFKKAWRKDALGTFQDFLKQLSKLDQFDASKVLKDIGITNTRDVNAVRLMSQNVGFVSDQLNVAENAQGALNKESQTFFDTTAGKWQTFQNQVRDVGNTIGTELLPIANDLFGEFSDFLNQPGTQQGIRDFAQSLAGGIRDLVGELQGTDWTPLIEGMKTAGAIAKTAFDAFNALPDPIKQLAVAAIVGNKVSGGALGQIAKGLGNIAFGALKIGFERGSTPANPLFVADIAGGGGAGGLGNLAGGGGKLGKIGKIGSKVLGFGGAIIGGVSIGTEIGGELIRHEVEPAKNFEQSSFEQLLASNDAARIEAGLKTINDTLNSSDPGESVAIALSRLPFFNDAMGNLAGQLEDQKKELSKRLDEVRKSNQTTDGILLRNASEHNAVIVKANQEASQKVTRQIDSHAASERADLRSLTSVSRTGADASRAILPHIQRVQGADEGLLGEARNARNFYSRTASATEKTSRKDFSPKIDNHVTVPVSVGVNASIIQKDIIKVTRTHVATNIL